MSGGGSQNHLKSYLQVPKTVTREEAYKGCQKLQTYKKDQIKAKIRVNGMLLEKACHINLGTRQGYLLSLLIFG